MVPQHRGEEGVIKLFFIADKTLSISCFGKPRLLNICMQKLNVIVQIDWTTNW